jgi:cyclopropane fatty-acyl-phospholipid synthase-like methyltransferase
MTDTDFPAGHEVGVLYDQIHPFADRLFVGQNMHFGYWTGPEDQSTAQEAQDRLTDMMTERVRLTPADRFLDIGCGLGGPTLRYARATGAHVTGVTVSSCQVAACEEQARAEGLEDRVEFHLADATDRLPFDDESFDAAWALESFPHMDRAAALREIARTLRPGARLALTDFLRPEENTENLTGMLENVRQQWMITLVSHDELLSLLEAAGFEVEESLDINANTARNGEMLARQLSETYGEQVMENLPGAGDVPGTYVLLTARKR